MVNLLLDSNRMTELSVIAWIVENKQMVQIPADYFFSQDTNAAFREIEKRYYETGDISESLYCDAVRCVIYESGGADTTVSGQPAIIELRRLWQRREALKATKQFSISENHQKDISDLILTLNKLNLDEIDEYDHQRSVTETSLYIYDSKKNGRNMLGISSNLETIDKYLNGWQRKKTYVIGGMEKLGKSRFCLELASCWLSKGIGGIEFSLEMSANDIHECIIGNRALIDTAKFGTDNITADELYRMSAKAGTYLNEPLYISTRSSVTLEYIRSVIRRQKIKFKSAGYDVVWVVVDYIQRMVDGDNRAGKLEDVAKGLADIARDEDVIMIPISQLSQEAERDAHPDYSPHRFIKGSKGIREAADVIIVIYKTKEGKHYAYIVQRKGKSNISIPLIPQLEFSRFRDDKAEGGF